MEVTKLLTLMCCIYYSYASHHSHTIPVEGYETNLEVLGQHVDIPETPVKVIKITKTVAVKVPIPYPVKVIQKVPYPVHISKPYPVPVPQIIKVPHIVTPKHNEHETSDHDRQFNAHEGNTYQVQETPSHEPINYGGQNQESGSYGEEYPSDGSSGNSYDGGSNYGDNDENSFESKSYDQAINQYLHKFQPNQDGGNFNNHYH